MSSVTVVIPNWNGGARLTRVVADLSKQTLKPARVVVVDNGSTDGSAEAARAAGCDVLAMGRNAGFAPAVNAGIRDCRTDLVAIVNNDVELDPQWLEHLCEALNDPRVWFATGKLWSLTQPGTLDGAYDLLSLARTAWRGGAGRTDTARWNRRSLIVSAPMTAAVFRRSLFQRVGLLDERFGSYLEDVDFGIRARLAGCAGIYVPEATGAHWGSATLGAWSAETVRLISRNQVFLVLKFGPRKWLSREGWSILVGQGLWAMVALRNAGLRGLAAWVRGKAEGIGSRDRFGRDRLGGAVLAREQRKLRDLQRETGVDTYWRLYFALTSRRRI